MSSSEQAKAYRGSCFGEGVGEGRGSIFKRADNSVGSKKCHIC